MIKSIKLQLALVFLVLASTTLACGAFQAGLITPTSSPDPGSLADNGSDIPSINKDTPVNPTLEPEELETTSDGPFQVTAWLGHIASLPETSQYDDMLILSPEGTGELGLSGASPDIEAEIRSLRDATGAQEYVHLWGEVTCGVDDYNQCQLVVDRMQYGANYSEEDIVNWVGTIRGSTFNGGVSFVFELEGDFPMWYSIYSSQDDSIQDQIESLRDTGAVVKVSGKLMAGVPDVNGTRIEASRIEVLQAGDGEPSVLDSTSDPTSDWSTFISSRYGYQVKYPAQASISLWGPEGFSAETLPENMTPEEYLDSLQKEYTDQLCVKIEYSLGWIYIAAPPNQDLHLNPCGPTGLGAGEINSKIETVEIAGQLYQAQGTEFKIQTLDADGNLVTGETLDLHGEMFLIELEDGAVIRFGSQPRGDATYNDYLLKTKQVLLMIISTYQSNS